MGTKRAHANGFQKPQLSDWNFKVPAKDTVSLNACSETENAPAGVKRGTFPSNDLGVPVKHIPRRWTFAEINLLGADRGFLPLEYWPRLVIIESPYAGDIETNTAYARAAMRDSLERGEFPIASHLLYTQPGILDEFNPKEREWGIRAGLAWREVAHAAVFYTDRGWSAGMLNAAAQYDAEGFDYEERTLAKGTSACG